MRLLKFIGIGLFLMLLLVTLAVAGYLYQLKPQYSGEITLPNLEDTVTVQFDDHGIPHIYGKNSSDTYYALGYLHAQERLFQMDLLRRVGAGELSEFFGSSTIQVDRLFHTLGLPEYARTSADKFDSLDPELQTIINQYLRGVNHFAETGPVPLEYLIAGLPREPFNVVDIYRIAGYMAFSFAAGLRTDPLVQHIHDQLGEEYLYDLALHHAPGEAVAPSGRVLDSKGEGILNFTSALDKIPVPLITGSNTWAVSGSKTASGKPILANDTHIGYSQPSTWFEAHLEYPGFRLYGNFLAGIPLALTGHSNQIAWGLTMFENDDMDFYREEFHPEDSMLIRSKNDYWVPLEQRKVVIKVKDAPNDTLLIRICPHGPLVNNILNQPVENPVSLFWTYTQKINQLPEAFYSLNRAQDMRSAKDAVQLIHAPGLNISFADTAGNIALWSAAHLIQRPDHVNSKLILDGATGADDPLGFYPFDANPQVENPMSGLIYSANSQHDSTAFGVMHPGYYTPPVRMERIAKMLKQREDWDIEKMKVVITDHYSEADAELAKHLFSILKVSADNELIEFYSNLETWQGDHDLQSAVPVLYYPFLYHLMESTFGDELGEEQFEAYLNTYLMKRTNFKIFYEDSSIWFDDVVTKETESKQDVVISAAKSAMNQLKKQYPDGNYPEWGEVHLLTFTHPMASVAPLDRLFNVGPYPIAGTNESINQQSFVYNDEGVYPVKHGPQMRILIDMAEIENSVSVNPTGQSGNRFSEYYSDQSEMFINGAFRPQLMNKKEIAKHSVYTLLFTPE